jgi:hypothetical protein
MWITSVSVTLPNPASFHCPNTRTPAAPLGIEVRLRGTVFMLSIGGVSANFVTIAIQQIATWPGFV